MGPILRMRYEKTNESTPGGRRKLEYTGPSLPCLLADKIM